MNAETMARLFHETYERLATAFGWKTKKGCNVPFEQLPQRNKALMIATCQTILNELQNINERGHQGGMRDKPAPSLTTTRSHEIECSGAPATLRRPAPQHSQQSITSPSWCDLKVCSETEQWCNDELGCSHDERAK
jgi:hypothetical protein